MDREIIIAKMCGTMRRTYWQLVIATNSRFWVIMVGMYWTGSGAFLVLGWMEQCLFLKPHNGNFGIHVHIVIWISYICALWLFKFLEVIRDLDSYIEGYKQKNGWHIVLFHYCTILLYYDDLFKFSKRNIFACPYVNFFVLISKHSLS